MPSDAERSSDRPSERPRRVAVDPGGPVLIEGPVEVTLDDGTRVVSERFTVALCTCRRSRTYPWCDTSHRGHRRTSPPGHRPGHPGEPAS
ncbi:CDGSH iron-sulfur domain-containing protein [Streptomyces sp. NPDC059398]|uniref:CDGSH iron-sulfur domain-containing protein n=1 Tax=Streptomyces sp. NPDC059398 TaxID=3346820 RepID=UPI0036A02982